MSRKNPYRLLKEKAVEYVNAVQNRTVREMWIYPKASISTDRWNLADLAQRVQAAEQLGYDVTLSWSDQGLCVRYIKKIPPQPWWTY